MSKKDAKFSKKAALAKGRNCLSCSRFSKCSKSKKSGSYVCESWKKIKLKNDFALSDMFGDSDFHEADDYVDFVKVEHEHDYKNMEVNLVKMMDSVFESDNPYPRDLKVDDRDLPEFANIYEYFFDPQYGLARNMQPFSRQLWVGVKLFGDYCVAEGTLINTENGLVPVEKMVGHPTSIGMNPLRFKVSTLKGNSFTSHGGMTGIKRKCLSVVTMNGREIVVTPEHKVATLSKNYEIEWKEARNLSDADYLVLPIGRNLWPTRLVRLPDVKLSYNHKNKRKVKTPKVCNEDFGEYLGYIAGDGYIGKTEINFCNDDFGLASRFAELTNKLFGLDVDVYTITLKTGKPFYHVNVSYAAVREFFDKIGIGYSVSYNKDIPDFILQSPKKVVVSYVRALFDCDGYVQKKPRIGITMAAEPLVRKLNLLLQNMGIECFYKSCFVKVSGRDVTDPKNKRGILEIKDRNSILSFANTIGSKHALKKSILASIESQGSLKNSNGYQGTYKLGTAPYGKDFYKHVRGRMPYHEKSIYRDMGRSESLRIDNLLSITTIKKYAPESFNNIKSLRAYNVSFSKVRTIKDAGYHKVYDLTVPDGENFTANGLIVHNCPVCSKPDFMTDIENCPIDMRAIDFPEHVVFLKNGKCPKCKGQKLDFVKKGYMDYYRDLVACLGQRCIAKDSLVLTEDGLVEIGDYAKNRPYGFSPFQKRFNNGTNLETTSKFYKARPERLYSIKTSGGQILKGTKDHPLMTDAGFLRLENLQLGSNVRVYYNQQCFGNSVTNLKDVTEKTDKEFEELVNKCHHDSFKRTKVKPGYGRHTKKFLDEDVARLLGYWVSEGRKTSISNSDPLVLQQCYETFIQMFSPNCVNIGKDYVNFSSKYIQLWLENLIGYDISKGSAHKRVPACILKAPKNIQVAFLQALYEGDGSAYGRTLEYCTISKKLSTELQAMLLNLGIPCRITKKMSWATNGSSKQVSKPVYLVLVYGNAIKTFQKEIGFLSKRKKKRLDRVIKKHNSRQNNSHHFYEKAPESYKTELLEIIALSGKQLNQVSYRDSKAPVFGLNSLYGSKGWDKLKRLRSHNVCATKAKIRYFLEPLLAVKHLISENLLHRINALLEFANSNYYYERVVSKKYSKRKYETYDVTLPDSHRFISNGLLSHNSGKSVSFSMFSGYHHHKYLKMGKPAELLTGLPNVTLTATFTATDFKTAMETLWQPFVDIIDESPWFQAYHELLNHYGHKYGEELYRFKESFLHYKHKKLFASASSPNKRTLRGRTRYEYAIDELGWFDASVDSKDKVRISADEIYGALDRSMKTVMSASKRLFLQGYNSITPGMSFNISSPSAYDDKIMSMCRTHKDSRVVLAIHLPTWKYNPKEPKSNFKKEYMEDPVKAERDFGANPPMAASPFYENTQAILPAFSEKSNCVEYEYQHKKVENKSLLYRFATVNIRPKADIYPSVLAIDAGFSNNSFAMVVGHRQDKEIVFSTLMEIAPDKGKNVLNYNAIFKLCVVPIIQKLNVRFICADRWNSLFLLHKLEEEEQIKQVQYSVKYSDFTLFKSYLEGGRIKFPRLEMPADKILKVPASEYLEKFKYKPASHLFSQIFTVEDKIKTVDKGKNRTDDLFRAVNLAGHFLLDDDWVKENLNTGKRRNGDTGIIALANGGTASNILSTSTGKGIIAT